MVGSGERLPVGAAKQETVISSLLLLLSEKTHFFSSFLSSSLSLSSPLLCLSAMCADRCDDGEPPRFVPSGPVGAEPSYSSPLDQRSQKWIDIDIIDQRKQKDRGPRFWSLICSAHSYIDAGL